MESVMIIDIPASASAAEASQALNSLGKEYFLVQVVPLRGGYWGIFRRYKQPVQGEASPGDDAVAMSIVRANRDKPVRTIVALLSAAGIKRGRNWVCDQLTATCGEDGREADALAFLRDHIHYEDRDIASELKFEKIKRTVEWVRRKRAELVPVPSEVGTECQPPIVG